MTELGAIKAYVKSKGRTADESYDYPVFTKVLNHRGVIERAWEINQNYILNAQNGYSTAQTRLRSFIPSGSAAISDTTTTYDDVANTISMNFYPDGSQSATTIVSTEIIDNNNIKMTVTGFPCLFENKTPVSSLSVYTPRSQLLRVTDRNGNVTAREYDTLNRVTKLIEAVDSNLQRQILYSYTTLSDGTINSTATPNAINAPEMNIVNLLNARGQIYRQEVDSPQSGSQKKIHLYSYYEDQNHPTYGLLHIYDAPRGDINDRTFYEYDIYGNLSKKTVIVNASTSGAVERNTVYRDYNSAGLPKSIILPDDSRDTIVYDGRYNVVKTTHYAGSQTQISQNAYDDLGRLISTTNADNQSTKYEYNDVHQLTKKTLPNNNTEVYKYYPNGESSVVIYYHANGTLAMSEWQELDENGRIKSYRKGGNTNSRWVKMNYDNNGNLIRTQTAQGIVNQWSYDQLNRVISHTDGNGYINQKSYDSADNSTLEVAANNHGSSRSFLDHRYLSAEQNADFGQKSYQYDLHQNISRYTHNERLCNYGVYDQIQRPSQFVCNHGNQSSNPDLQVNDSYEYDSSGFGHLDQVRSPWVNTQYSYDHLHRIVAKSQLNKTATKYTNRNNTLNNFYSYSAGGLLTSITYPSGNRVDYNYNADGSLNNIKLNQQSLIQDIQYTGIDQLQRFNWGRGGSYVVGYDDTGNILNILNGNNNAVSFALNYRYDLDGRIVVQEVDNVSTNYSYDQNNQLIQERTPYYTSHHSYDNNGNQTFLEVSSNPGSTANSQPGCAFNATAYAEYYQDLKRAFGYNRDLLLGHWLRYGIVEGRTPCGAIMPQCKFEPLTYRSIWADLVRAQVDGNVHYRNNGVYEGRGICSKATSSNDNNYLNIIASRGLPTAERQPSCAFNATAYADYYPDIKNAFGYNQQLLFDHWLKNGMPEGRTPCGALMPQCRFDGQAYRNLWSDLVRAQVEGVWHYHSYGAKEGRGICPASNSVNYAGMNFVYTANHLTGLSVNGATQALGNFATGELSLSGNVAYDYAGRRRSESYGTQQVYFDYNHKNERTLRVGGGLNYQYIYDEASHLLGEYELNGNTMVEYIWFGDKPIAALYGHGQLVYLVTDHQNKPRRGIDASSNEIVWRWDPDAYGVTQPVGRVNIHLRFPGQLFDGQSGLYYNHNRYYNPLLGRYMEADPIGLEGGLNPYSYCYQNPVMYVDPTGAIPIPVITGAIGGVMGGGASLGIQIAKNKGLKGINWKDVGIAAGVGAVAGAVSPWTATTAIGAVVTSSVSSSVGYGVTEYANNRSPTTTGFIASAALGAVGGRISGPVQKAPIRFAPSQFISPTEAARANRSVDWNYFLNNSNKFIGIGNVGGAVISSDPLGMNSMNFQLNQQLLQNQYDKYAYRLPIVHQLPPIVVTAETNISREFQNNVNQYMNSWK